MWEFFKKFLLRANLTKKKTLESGNLEELYNATSYEVHIPCKIKQSNNTITTFT